MKKLLVTIAVSFVLSGSLLYAQQKIWKLDECIYYAIDNNIQIKQQDIQTDYQKNTLDLSKLRLLPTLSGTATQNYSWGRALDETTYRYTDNTQARSNSFYVGGNMNIFAGLQNYNTIKKYEYELLAGEQDLQNIKENIALTVALNYLQILLNKELVTTTNDQLQITLQQIEKTRKLVDAGSTARGNLLQIESQAAQEELQLINIMNQLDVSYLDLTQLLEFKSPTGFEIEVPDIAIDSNEIISETVEEIYAIAQGARPSVKSSELKLAASEYDLKIAKGSRSPRISMNHSFNTGYSDIRQKILGIDPADQSIIYGEYPFSEQVSDNINWGLGFTLAVPILNGWQVNKSISNSKLEIESSKYALEGAKKQLYKNIQQAYADAVAALKKYNASNKAVTSMQESFRYTEQKFNVGLVTPIDYNAAKSQLLQAQSALSQAKYEYIFKTKVLDFYRGIPLNLASN
ncbi:MAG: TolC family protein [Bacteroidales bacterium]|jgi:outer membrane protein|nr:TolC family protein [Bacteroidales bacterium]MCU0408220.1 TolC family protein [Bacteroidales bacterium]